jgi:hypothetical protein
MPFTISARKGVAAYAAIGFVLLSVPLVALEVQVKELRAPTAMVAATLELRDVVPDRFRKTLDGGGVLHLRVQTELWESRPVWDRLMYPAIVRIFRFSRGANNVLSVVDPAGVLTTYVTPPRALPMVMELGDRARLTPAARYYVHVIATLGTLAEREADEVGDAVFGRESEANGLGSLGKLMFRTVLQINDYLQSVTAEARTRKTAGTDILAGTRP